MPRRKKEFLDDDLSELPPYTNNEYDEENHSVKTVGMCSESGLNPLLNNPRLHIQMTHFTMVPVAALIIATALFPAVFHKTFNKVPSRMQKNDPNVWYLLQISVAFQNGFFWQALLSLIVPK